MTDYVTQAVDLSLDLARTRTHVHNLEVTTQAARERERELRGKLAPVIWDAYHRDGVSAPQIAAAIARGLTRAQAPGDHHRPAGAVPRLHPPHGRQPEGTSTPGPEQHRETPRTMTRCGGFVAFRRSHLPVLERPGVSLRLVGGTEREEGASGEEGQAEAGEHAGTGHGWVLRLGG